MSVIIDIFDYKRKLVVFWRIIMGQEIYKTFIIVAETKNFSKAAERLNVVQSTVSNRIKELEKSVEKNLFTRNNKRVEITNAGRILLPYAKKIVQMEEDGQHRLKIGDHYEESLYIESADSIFRGTVIKTVAWYMNIHKKVAVKIKIRHSEDIIQNLLDNMVDVGFTYIKPVSSKLEVYKFQEEEIILVTNKMNHTYIDGISAKELQNIGLFYSGIGEKFNDWLYSLYPHNHIFHLDFSHASNLIEFLKEGIGYGFVLKSAVKNELYSNELIEIKLIDRKPPKLQSYMIINKKRIDSPPIKYWLEALQGYGHSGD